MNAQGCCPTRESSGETARRPTWGWRRGSEAAGWIVPTATLALLRATLLVLCVASLVFIATRRARSFLVRGISQSPQ